MELGERVPYKRKLIEVAFLLDAVSKALLREKSIRGFILPIWRLLPLDMLPTTHSALRL